jgi:two-component system chemotaxis response regulator CheY
MTKVLVVDDSVSVRQQVQLALAQAGIAVVEAGDGAEGIAALEADARAGDPGIALIISDVNMPRMNGLEMLEKLVADARWCALPVLMLTSEGQPDLIARAKRAGARGWIVKPFKPDLLIAAVRKITAAKAA